jgi:hypothetical protein
MISGNKIYDTTMEVDILDAEGYATGRSALVWISVLVETDMNYGADADGRRGIPKIEYHVSNVSIDPHDLVKMTVEEAEQCMKEAEDRFMNCSDKHFEKYM